MPRAGETQQRPHESLYEAVHRLDRSYSESGHRRDADMINGAHAILYSDDAAATRATLAKVLGTRTVDAGDGWLIFALPPAEIAVHPAARGGRAELYLMTDDVTATVAALQAEGIEIARPISDQGWGLLTAITLPGGVELGLYQPRHPTAAQPT
jgi:catechol 2,3-dioxygenase-like lactoylglutathione lyase family enzyme